MSEPTRKAVRATLEDVISNQGILYDLLGELAHEKRPLRKEERHKFIEYVARAFMGQGIKIKADGEFQRIVDTELPGGAIIENAEDALRYMSLLTAKTFCDDEGNEYGISELWKDTRRIALRVFPIALKAAAAMSTEQWYRRGGTPPDSV